MKLQVNWLPIFQKRDFDPNLDHPYCLWDLLEKENSSINITSIPFPISSWITSDHCNILYTNSELRIFGQIIDIFVNDIFSLLLRNLLTVDTDNLQLILKCCLSLLLSPFRVSGDFTWLLIRSSMNFLWSSDKMLLFPNCFWFTFLLIFNHVLNFRIHINTLVIWMSSLLEISGAERFQ